MTDKTTIFDNVLKLIDKLFLDASGRILLERIVVIIILFIMALIWTKIDVISHTYKEARYENYAKIEKEQRNKNFEASAREHSQILYTSSKADLVAIYSYKPSGVNNFSELIAYQGKLPQHVDIESANEMPIDKSSRQYIEHMTGLTYQSDIEFPNLPIPQYIDVRYMYSCPFFNVDNVYSGSIEFYWLEAPEMDKAREERLFAICHHTARALGRMK